MSSVAMRKPVSDHQLNQLNSVLGINHVICFEAMEIKKIFTGNAA